MIEIGRTNKKRQMNIPLAYRFGQYIRIIVPNFYQIFQLFFNSLIDNHVNGPSFHEITTYFISIVHYKKEGVS